MRPTLADYGLTLKRLDDDVWQLTGDALLLSAEIENAVAAWAKADDRRLRELRLSGELDRSRSPTSHSVLDGRRVGFRRRAAVRAVVGHRRPADR
ncbi:MAG: hypothetical protein QM811_29430 [Pirellulales bacterium]